MNWQSVQQIAKELNLKATPSDYDALKGELRSNLASIHPDKNGGAFAKKEDEDKYNAISSAYEFVNTVIDRSHALIPVSQLPAIIKAVRDAQVAPTQTQINALRTECRSESRVASRDRYILPRIGSGTFAAVCGALFTFSGALAEHPILGQFAKNILFQYGLLIAAAYAGFFFLLTWLREMREESKVEWLMSDEGRRLIFEYFLRKARDPIGRNRNGRFAARQVVETILEDSGHRLRFPSILDATMLFSRGRITSSVAEKIADMHLLELEQRGAIHRIGDPSIDVIYEFDEQVLNAEGKNG